MSADMKKAILYEKHSSGSSIRAANNSLVDHNLGTIGVDENTSLARIGSTFNIVTATRF
jgi:hypothetical protein